MHNRNAPALSLDRSLSLARLLLIDFAVGSFRVAGARCVWSTCSVACSMHISRIRRVWPATALIACQPAPATALFRLRLRLLLLHLHPTPFPASTMYSTIERNMMKSKLRIRMRQLVLFVVVVVASLAVVVVVRSAVLLLLLFLLLFVGIFV